MNNQGSLNYRWAFSLIHHFTQLGVVHAVISPGSRSTPLALACEKHPKVITWIQIDERSGGFFALGLAQRQQRPVILICTSGSAVANWYPAVVEASHSYTPLLLLSADRPAELQNCGANQTIDQKSLFSPHVRQSFSLEDASETLLNKHYLPTISQQAYQLSIEQKPGPVHINIPLREPLLPKLTIADDLNHFIEQLGNEILHRTEKLIPASTNKKENIPQKQLELLSETINSGSGIIICGRLNMQEQAAFHPLLIKLSQQLNSPVLIDPLSNTRLSKNNSAHFIYNYDHFLKQTETDVLSDLNPDWIIRFGQFPVSKNLLLYLQLLDCHSILISSYGDKLDPIHKTNTQVQCSPGKFCEQLAALQIQAKDDFLLTQWQALETKSTQKIHQAVLDNEDLFEGQVIHTLLQSIPDNSFIFSGNSMAIRDFDTFITQQSIINKKIDFFSNRGVSGIDGNLSTFLGLLASQASDKTRQYGVALVGDLTFYHDMNGLLICRQLSDKGLNATIILINNSGGGIFNYLPQQQLDSFDKLWTTDTELDFQYSARLYGLNYHKIMTQKELQSKLPKIFTLSGIQLVEIIIDQKISVECHKQI